MKPKINKKIGLTKHQSDYLSHNVSDPSCSPPSGEGSEGEHSANVACTASIAIAAEISSIEVVVVAATEFRLVAGPAEFKVVACEIVNLSIQRTTVDCRHKWVGRQIGAVGVATAALNHILEVVDRGQTPAGSGTLRDARDGVARGPGADMTG